MSADMQVVLCCLSITCTVEGHEVGLDGQEQEGVKLWWLVFHPVKEILP